VEITTETLPPGERIPVRYAETDLAVADLIAVDSRE
jgi:hypothetical protein